MGKATVENSQRLDAHFWATDPIRRMAQHLVETLTDYLQLARAGETTERKGLIPMQWTRGWDKSPAGNIKWGALAESDGQITRLLLLFQVTSRGQAYPRRQEVVLVWQTSTGQPARKPVLLCPFCGRRCRFLCAAYPGRQGGPYLGEFACRQCAGLCYAKQLEYQSAWAKSMDTVLGLAAKARLHPERLTEADVSRAKSASWSFHSFGNRRIDKLMGLAGRRGIEEEDADPEERRIWDLLPPPMFAPPKRRGRPSPKRERQQARACAKFLREAQKEAMPKHPGGRPKERRAYDGASRTAGGCAGRLGADEGYCVGCRARRQLVEAVPFTASNGRAGIKGRCGECGRGLCRMGVAPSPLTDLNRMSRLP